MCNGMCVRACVLLLGVAYVGELFVRALLSRCECVYVTVCACTRVHARVCMWVRVCLMSVLGRMRGG